MVYSRRRVRGSIGRSHGGGMVVEGGDEGSAESQFGRFYFEGLFGA